MSQLPSSSSSPALSFVVSSSSSSSSLAALRASLRARIKRIRGRDDDDEDDDKAEEGEDTKMTNNEANSVHVSAEGSPDAKRRKTGNTNYGRTEESKQQQQISASTAASLTSSPATSTSASTLASSPAATEYNPSLNIPHISSTTFIPHHWRRFDASQTIQQDLSQHFVNRGSCADRPQNWIRDRSSEVDDATQDGELVEYRQRMLHLITESNLSASYQAKRVDFTRTNLLDLLEVKEHGTEFDVILIDPPWSEYKEKKMAATAASALNSSTNAAASPSSSTADDDDEVWSYSQIKDLPIPALAAEPSLLFIWCGSGRHVTEAYDLMKSWGWYKIEDIAWLQTNRTTRQPGYTSSDTLFQRTFEHCIVGIKGREYVLRDRDLTTNTLPHSQRMELGLVQFVCPGAETDVIVSEAPPQSQLGSSTKPKEIYDLIERFCVGRRRLELFGTDENLRNGWVTIGKGISPELEQWDLAQWRKRFEQPMQIDMPQLSHDAYLNQPLPHYPSPFDARIGGTYLPFDPRTEQLRPKSPPAPSKVKRFQATRPRKGWKPIRLQENQPENGVMRGFTAEETKGNEVTPTSHPLPPASLTPSSSSPPLSSEQPVKLEEEYSQFVRNQKDMMQQPQQPNTRPPSLQHPTPQAQHPRQSQHLPSHPLPHPHDSQPPPLERPHDRSTNSVISPRNHLDQHHSKWPSIYDQPNDQQQQQKWPSVYDQANPQAYPSSANYVRSHPQQSLPHTQLFARPPPQQPRSLSPQPLTDRLDEPLPNDGIKQIAPLPNSRHQYW